jgi:hypothetical protein
MKHLEFDQFFVREKGLAIPQLLQGQTLSPKSLGMNAWSSTGVLHA